MTIFLNLVRYLTANYPLSTELQCFWMAFQGCIIVRSGPNKDGKMKWFHAFMKSTITAYAGASFANLWIGRPTSMLSNDLNFAFCAIAYAFVNCLPFDIGFKIGTTLPVVLVTTSFAQLFRSMGIVKFCEVGHAEFHKSPSAYYPTPIVGPIMFATMLGNMGGFFSKGFDGHLKDGMPWAFQNGLFCASFYHFYVNDREGFVGIWLRQALSGVPEFFDLDERTFAVSFVSLFMQVMGFLQLPQVWGAGFTPFGFPRLASAVLEYVPKAETKPGSGFPTTKDGKKQTNEKKDKDL
uniref:Uncharacterized protein n=1 Tax=Trieres chinensis TaxID=1514140 RepID=A0A7S1YX91_TRICV